MWENSKLVKQGGLRFSQKLVNYKFKRVYGITDIHYLIFNIIRSNILGGKFSGQAKINFYLVIVNCFIFKQII